jgi:hypothetical protein
MRQWDDLGSAVDLNIIGAVEFFSVHQQRDLRIAPDVLDLVRAFARGNGDSAIRADYRCETSVICNEPSRLRATRTP